MSRDYLTIPYRQTREYRDAVRMAAKQRAGMTYRRASVDYVSGMTASAACRRG
jgi:dGTP triphosphohydrolase